MAVDRLRCRNGRAVDDLCKWRKTAAAVDHCHLAVHRAHNDIPVRGFCVRRTFWSSADDRIPDDLDRAGHLFGLDASPDASKGVLRMRGAEAGCKRLIGI